MILPGPNQRFLPHRTFAALLGSALMLGSGITVPAEPAFTLSQAARTSEALEALKQRDLELEAVRSSQQQAGEVEAKLRREIESISADRRKLNAQLIATASRVRAAEVSIAATESRLKPLEDNERSIRAALQGRRAVIAEVLAALQRMGRRPPPALLVRPDDALQSVRSAMMLGAILPEMRQEAVALADDLADLIRVRKEIAAEHERLQRDLKAMAEEQQRLSLLTAERQKQQVETESALSAARKKAIALARDADNLKDLIAKLERGLDSATRAARATERAKQDGAEPGSGGADDAGRLAPAVAFGSAKGMLPMPVNGVTVREYGASDGYGGVEKGLLLATRSRAQVTAPCDGWVIYAGTFRSYGQLLILDAGGGYHVLLAGMDRTSVDIGQFVLTGEPVAVMGSGSQVAAILAAGSSQPVLYVEFRKNGTPIDPSPWWAASEGEKARG
ncbi:MAG: peptidoglycan DD-metalloendopeptidase family protein [Rhizobiales bacterium]|nr:peptidoglycan DD-metalloendopeptidase family protein [Hyphomicrobiales bacterium]